MVCNILFSLSWELSMMVRH